MAKKKEPTPTPVSGFYLPEILREMGTQAKAPTSTDSIYGGAAVGSRTGAFQEAAPKSDGYSTGGITPTPEQIAYGAARAGGQNPMSGEDIAKDFAKTREAAKDVAVGLAQPFIRPVAQVLAPTIEKFVNAPVTKDFTGAPEDKDFKFPNVNVRGQSLYKQDYGVGDAVSDAAWIVASTVPYAKGAKAVASAAESAKTAVKGKKLVSETEKALAKAAKEAPDGTPPSGGVNVTTSTPPKTPPSRPVTKTDIASGKYGTVAGELSSGSGISSRVGTATPQQYATGQQFAQAANRSSSALGETTRTMGVNESTVLTKPPTTVAAPKAQVPKTPSSIKPSDATNPFTEAAAAAASAAAKGASRVSQAIAAGTTGSVIRGIANQSSSATPPTTPPSGMGPQFITRSGLEIWSRPGSGAPSDTPPPKPNKPELQTSAEISATPQDGTKTPPKDQTDTPLKRQEGTKYDPTLGPKLDPDAGVSKPNPDPTKPPGGDGGTTPPPGKFDEPAPPKDEPPTRKKIPNVGGGTANSPSDSARIPYIP